jgi:GTP-binding protein
MHTDGTNNDLIYPSDDPKWMEKGRYLFSQPVTFKQGCTKVDNLPPEGLPEVAFAGRSNVGKSSLINALVNQKNLARTSNTPGRTQEINFFNLVDQGFLVDLPGYGYAKESKSKVVSWNNLIRDYLRGRSVLRRVFMLIDSRHGIKEVDLEIFELLTQSAVTFQIVLTKIDKIKKAELEKCFEKTKAGLKKFVPAHPKILVTSSEKKLGLEEVRAEIAGLL